MDNDTPLMDLVYQATFSKNLDGKQSSKKTLRVLAKYRMALRRAHRFVIDDDAVRLISNIDKSDEDRMKAFTFLARLPYDTCWFEFSLHVKVKESEKMGTLQDPFNAEEVSPKLGFLMYHDDSETRWIAHMFVMINGTAVPGIYAIVFDPEGNEISTVRGSKLWQSQTLSLRKGGFPKIPIQVFGSTEIHTVDIEYIFCGVFGIDNNSKLTSLDSFVSKLGVIIDPFWEDKLSLRNGLKAETMIEESKQNSGAASWLITLLATINSLPRDIKPVVTKPGRRAVGMNLLPYLQHHKITIHVPRDNRVVWAQQHIDRALRNSRRPWHEVIGHWRIIEKGKAKYVGHRCRHVPTMVEEGVGMCENCQLMIRWIKDHTRGDPTIGVVNHTYAVKT